MCYYHNMSHLDTQRILDAAQHLVREHGADFTMEQLEDAVGVSRATLYRRIGSRAALLDRLATERDEVIDDTNRQILRAVRAVIGREGLAGATIEQVASEAGVGVATVYRRFETKEGLLRAFIDEMTPRQVIRSLSDTVGEDIGTELHGVVSVLVAFVHDLRDVLRIALLGDARDREYMEGLRQRSDSSFGWLTTYFERRQSEGMITEAVEARDLALGLMGLVLGFAMIGPLHYGTAVADTEATAHVITEMFLSGVEVRS